MDYGTLKTVLQSYLHRDDDTTVNMIATFVKMAQARMSRDLEIPELQATDSLTVTASDTVVSLPSDCLELCSVRIPYKSGYRLVQQNSLFQNSQMLEAYNGSTSTPYYYARYGKKLELTPTPESDTTLEVVYRKLIANFTSDTDTDDILTNYPNIYIYASMIEASPFIMDDTRTDTWGSLYKEEVIKINEIGYRSEWSGAPMQIKSLGVDTP